MSDFGQGIFAEGFCGPACGHHAAGQRSPNKLKLAPQVRARRACRRREEGQIDQGYVSATGRADGVR